MIRKSNKRLKGRDKIAEQIKNLFKQVKIKTENNAFVAEVIADWILEKKPKLLESPYNKISLDVRVMYAVALDNWTKNMTEGRNVIKYRQ